ncbi:MAG: hypothetical protein HY290_04060 [Planctomycetia bacterium]|nr:hypothetical protein [Planctomycetia bacterium]
MSDLASVWEINNVQRAWRWITSNPEATYKRYCRDLYTAYAVADDVSLADLRLRLRKGTYSPAHAAKILFPKSSGILRPYSILTVEDQIVYQAFANVVAEKLAARVRHRYLKEVFGHLYAGRRSVFFYRKWDRGYSALNDACRTAFERGYIYGASFDLTACYDSVDHGVLRHFLAEIGCDKEFAGALSGYLSHWTATNHRVYHDHGIPQGPLSSGMLAEVVLQHFDNHRGAKREIRYVRYVDDIRLFAKTPIALRRMLVRLDMLSKDIGLFPQSSKVHIHKIIDIEEELKSISNPPEEVLTEPDLDQEKLRRRLVALTPHCRIAHTTRFKYLLGRAKPSSLLNDRLWKVLENHPDAYGGILRYFQRYKMLPASVAKRLLDEMSREPLYHAVHAEMVRTGDGRLPTRFRDRFRRIVKRQWHPSSNPPELGAVLGGAAIRMGLLTYAQTRYAVLKHPDWWVRTELINALIPKYIGAPSLEGILNSGIRADHVDDVCMMAAMAIARTRLSVRAPSRDVKRRAANVLREFGQMRRRTRDVCGIDQMYIQLLGSDVAGINWRKLFEGHYRRAEQQAVTCRALVTTNLTAWIPALDVLNDLLLASIFAKCPAFGSHSIGSFGTLYKNPAFKTGLPQTWKMVHQIHEKRLESELAHAIVKRTGKPTGRIKFGYLRTARRLLRLAVSELRTHFAL